METSQKNTNCESNNPIQCENIGTEEIQTILARLAALEAANESQAQRIVELEREVQQLKEQKPKKTLKKKKKKKKRGKSGYNVFMGEKMKELKAADSDLKGKDAMKAASKIWNTLEESEKEDYKARAKAENEAKAAQMKKIAKKSLDNVNKKNEKENNSDSEESDSDSEDSEDSEKIYTKTELKKMKIKDLRQICEKMGGIDNIINLTTRKKKKKKELIETIMNSQDI